MGKDQELLQAVKTEDLLTVQKLLQRPKAGKSKLLGSAKKVNVNIQDIDGFAPLHHAALSGNLELISLLLESQAAVDVRDQKGMRPLHYAAWQGRLEPMKMLLKSGSSVNGQSDEGQIPLHLAAQHGHYDVSEMLLQHQSNPCIVDNSGKTPLDLACEFGRVAVVQLLLNSNMCAALLEPKPGDPNGTSPLHLAAKNGHIDIIRLLIQAGIDINRQTKAGTALHEAALCGKTDVVRLLLDSGINASVRNTYSQTALDIVHQFTATQASKEIKQMLREASTTLQVRGLKDYCNNYDLTSLSIKAGDVITVLEQHPDGRWKGCIHDNRTGNDRVGFFPSSVVEVISKRAGSRGSDSSPHGSPSPTTGPQGSASEEIWVLRKPTAGNSWAASLPSPAPSLHHCDPRFLASVVASVEPMGGLQADLAEWLSMVGLGQYYQVLVQNGYENIDFIANITWEDLQEIGITKLGHQKKLMLAVKKLAEFQKGPEGRKKKAPQSAEIMAIQSPPPDTGGGVSPKLTTFQDSELSGELQAALAPVDRQQGTEGKARARSATSRSQEEAGIMTGPPKKEARSSRQSSQGTSRVSVPSAQAKQRQYTSPQTPTKVKPSSPQSTGPAQSKGKGTPHAIVMPTEQPTSLPVVPQSPTHRGKVHTESQDSQVAPPPSLAPSTAPATVPLLCLPPEEDESVQGQSQRRARSLSRHAASDSEEQAGTPDGGLHPGMGRSTPSPASSPGQADKNVNRSHSFARPRKKGPPPPPPKRSSSAISSTNLSDEPKEEPRPSGALLDVNYRPQRRASDLGGAVDTGSAGSVRSIAAMLEMSSIGGGAKARVMQKSPVGQNFLQVLEAVVHPRDAIGLDGEVVNRRRTISGPVTELVAAARREKGPREAGTEPEPQPEKIQAEGKPSRQGKGENGHEMVLPQEEESSNADTALRRSSRARSQGEGVRFQLIESSTVKRRPKSRDKDSEEEPQDGPVSVPAPCQNGTVTTKRRPISEVAVTEPADSLDLGSQAPEIRKPAKPPVSPKPVLAHHLKKQGGSGSSSKSVPLPGPESPEVKRVPPPVSPKPAPPPTAPKPSKVHIIPHGIGVTPGLSSAPYVARIASTPTPPSQSPQSSQPPGPPAPAPIPTPTPTPPPAKPPRSSISGVSLDGGGGVEAVQQRLEETSASLAAALQAVEEKIRKEDGLKDNAASEEKSTVSILDDIGSMFDDLADQLDAMLE
uniref:CASK interacting protein 1 n=1 Tax=Scleropages formosus TaxID=113540 RepID=A0A8C9RTW9_SCLFO